MNKGPERTQLERVPVPFLPGDAGATRKIGATPAGVPISQLLRHKWSGPGWGHGTPGGCQRLRLQKTQLCLSALGWDTLALGLLKSPDDR